jgi:hypothetical protein
MRKFTQLRRMIVLGIAGCAEVSLFAAGGPIQPGANAPDFTLSAVRGGVFTLRQSVPQPALIAFLQTVPDNAGTPSRSEVALLQSMDRQYSKRGLRVAIVDATALAAGRQPDRGSLINASYDWNLQIPLLEDESGRVAAMFGVTHVPATILVKADGTVAQIWERPLAPGELAIAIEKALGGGPLAPGSAPAPKQDRSPQKWKRLVWNHAKIVGHRKYPGHAVGSDAGKILVAFAVDYALKRHVPILDDDADGLLNTQGVLLKGREVVDRAKESQARSVVGRRQRQHFDGIHYVVDSLDVLDGAFSV